MQNILEGNSVNLIGQIGWGQTGVNGPDWHRVVLRGTINMSMWKISCVRSQDQTNPQNRQISHYRYACGQPRSLTSDDLWKVKTQCQRPDVVIRWSKSFIISPFLSITASYVAENKISWTFDRRLYLLWCNSSVTWPNPVKKLPKVAQRVHQSAMQNCSAIRTVVRRPFQKRLVGLHHHSPCTEEG